MNKKEIFTREFSNSKNAYLRRDQLETIQLPPRLLVDDVLHLGVGLPQGGVQHLVLWYEGCESQ